ncbi:MAG: mechanosensitive ion channel domain-containing protein, partial [Polyangiales bacterium]
VAGLLGRGALARALPSTDHIDPERLGGVVQILVVGVSVLVAVQQLGIDVGFLTTVVTIALVGFFAASALAFGFGGRATVANILAGHYVRELYEVGNTVRIQGLEGRIVRMTATAVILSTHEGETAVPTHLFVEALSTRVASRGQA